MNIATDSPLFRAIAAWTDAASGDEAQAAFTAIEAALDGVIAEEVKKALGAAVTPPPPAPEPQPDAMLQRCNDILNAENQCLRWTIKELAKGRR